jgi:hypothetical protein
MLNRYFSFYGLPSNYQDGEINSRVAQEKKSGPHHQVLKIFCNLIYFIKNEARFKFFVNHSTL